MIRVARKNRMPKANKGARGCTCEFEPRQGEFVQRNTTASGSGMLSGAPKKARSAATCCAKLITQAAHTIIKRGPSPPGIAARFTKLQHDPHIPARVMAGHAFFLSPLPAESSHSFLMVVFLNGGP